MHFCIQIPTSNVKINRGELKIIKWIQIFKVIYMIWNKFVWVWNFLSDYSLSSICLSNDSAVDQFYSEFFFKRVKIKMINSSPMLLQLKSVSIYFDKIFYLIWLFSFIDTLENDPLQAARSLHYYQIWWGNVLIIYSYSYWKQRDIYILVKKNELESS